MIFVMFGCIGRGNLAEFRVYHVHYQLFKPTFEDRQITIN